MEKRRGKLKRKRRRKKVKNSNNRRGRTQRGRNKIALRAASWISLRRGGIPGNRRWPVIIGKQFLPLTASLARARRSMYIRQSARGAPTHKMPPVNLSRDPEQSCKLPLPLLLLCATTVSSYSDFRKIASPLNDWRRRAIVTRFLKYGIHVIRHD